MAISEQQRQRLFRRVEEVLGPEEAATFMEVVLPASISDIATKRDLDALAQSVTHRLDELERRMVDKAELQRELRQLFVGILTANASVAGLAIAIASAL